MLKYFVGVDTNTGAVFCSECDDFIYEPTLDTEYKRTLLAVDEKNAHFLCTAPILCVDPVSTR